MASLIFHISIRSKIHFIKNRFKLLKAIFYTTIQKVAKFDRVSPF
jgi:hypothetical protein